MSPFRPHPLKSIPYRMPAAPLFCTFIIFILLTCPAVLAASATISPTDGTGDLPEIANPADVQEFFDEAVPAGMAKYNIPGAVVAVVTDGELVYAKGYGYADIDTQAAVDPEATLFHVGSITKLFTWTCVMQQVEAGTIDLDADVNTYLKDFSLPETYPGDPITMRHLMTHSAGFEEEEVHFAVAEPADLYSYRIYCEENIPGIVFPPGTVSAYSNYGTTLAAVILEDVTGVPYDEYVQENILTPLGMTDTIVSYPEAPEADAITASGYHFISGTNVALPDTVFIIGPAGTISAPATDMAKFVAMHMENGTWNGAEIISADTARLMHAPAFANDPRVSSMCLGFYENHINGERIITHGGDTDTFHSLLVIIPERKAGYFVSYNSAGGNSARNDLLMAFVDHFYPVPETTEPAVTAETTTSVDTYAGTYQSTRHNYRTFEFWLTPPQQIQVEAGEDDGTILMSRGGRPPVAYTEVEPGVFVQADGTETYAGNVVFRENADGDVTFLCLENVPIMAFERVPWYGTDAASASVRNLGIIILLSVFLWPLMAIGKYVNGPQNEESEKRNDEQDNSDIPFPFYARLLAGTASVLFILFVLFLLPAVTGDTALIQAYMLERTAPPGLVMALSVPVIATILAIATAASAVFVWRKAYWTPWHRMHYTLITIGLFMLVWWVNYWNLFIFRM